MKHNYHSYNDSLMKWHRSSEKRMSWLECNVVWFANFNDAGVNNETNCSTDICLLIFLLPSFPVWRCFSSVIQLQEKYFIRCTPLAFHAIQVFCTSTDWKISGALEGCLKAGLKDPSQPHLCYCLQYRILDRITRHTRGKGQRYNLKISTRKTCHDSFAFILILTSN